MEKIANVCLYFCLCSSGFNFSYTYISKIGIYVQSCMLQYFYKHFPNTTYFLKVSS
jgi:hypothetical protein